MENDNNKELFILGKQTYRDALFFYQKADVIYQLSFSFCAVSSIFTKTAHATK